MTKVSSLDSSLSNLPLKAFYFIRHGETDWNKIKRVMGSTDIPLNDLGLKQAQIASKITAKIDFDYIFASPLQRTYKTAEILNIDRNLTIIKNSGLMEWKLGSLEGKNVTYLRKKIKNNSLPINAESWEKFGVRVYRAVNEILIMPEVKLPLIVSHGGVFRSLTQALCGNIIPINNCELYYFIQPTESNPKWDIKLCL